MCREVHPERWACGCRYGPGDIPGLPGSFVRYCNRRLGVSWYGLPPIPCQDLHRSDHDKRIPWLCSRCYSLTMSVANIRPRSRQEVKITKANSQLLCAVLYPDGQSLPQIRLSDKVRLSLHTDQNWAQDDVEMVQSLRNEVMHEYLGDGWYRKVWRPIDNDATARLSLVTPPTAAAWHPPQWLVDTSVPTAQVNGPVADPCATLSKFELISGTVSQASSTTPLATSPPLGQSVARLLADHLRLVLSEGAVIHACLSSTPFELLYADFLRTMTVPSLTLLLDEQMSLDNIFCDNTFRCSLRIIDGIGRADKEARQEARAKMHRVLKVATRIWRARYDRIGSNEIVLDSCPGGHRKVRIKVIPDRITEYFWGEEDVVTW